MQQLVSEPLSVPLPVHWHVPFPTLLQHSEPLPEPPFITQQVPFSAFVLQQLDGLFVGVPLGTHPQTPPLEYPEQQFAAL